MLLATLIVLSPMLATLLATLIVLAPILAMLVLILEVLFEILTELVFILNLFDTIAKEFECMRFELALMLIMFELILDIISICFDSS